jgi:GalNAc-alpha-(1->4)-GalNAc-alpha-(1->3)-diNAcBac-PP-undecaprenol alpha-1,4-N-acetyl-D-galactosaminyltransferase
LKQKTICLVTPSFTAGGAERVLSELANHFIKEKNLVVHLIILIGGKQFYNLDKRIIIHKPKFDYTKYSRLIFTFKIMSFLRSVFKRTNPEAVLSFGGKYNAFVLVASFGIKTNVYISDRSRPSISYGKLLDIVNPIIYKKATGIIAQTSRAKKILFKVTGHSNIKVIGNPIRSISLVEDIKKDKIILNVGRFIESKHQDWLIDYFISLDLPDWKLIFLGEGPLFEEIRTSDKALKYANIIIFKGNVEEIDHYYKKASVFAFTSLSEGFPNALGEALKAGVACISFDCEAGPSDLIEHGVNGYLVDNNDNEAYKLYLKKLCNNEKLRDKFGKKSIEKMKDFQVDKIADEYYKFILNTID